MEPTMQSPAAPVEITSFGTRAVNVLTSPGELYAEVAAAPVRTSSWLIPYLVTIVLTVLMVFSLMNNPVLFDQMQQAQREEMQKKVDSHELTQTQADQAEALMGNKTMLMAVGSVTGVLFLTLIVFCSPLVYWLVSKGVLKFGGGYRKILEVYGLSMIIGIVGVLVSMIMMNMMDSMYAQPSGAFFIRETYQASNFGHNLLGSMNIFSIWQVVVLGIGLAAVSAKKVSLGMAVAFAIWLVYVVIMSLLGWGAH